MQLRNILHRKLENDVSDLPYSILTSDELKKTNLDLLHFTPLQTVTTDVVLHGHVTAFISHVSSICHSVLLKTRLNHVLAEHATATIEELNYDDCVRKRLQLKQMTIQMVSSFKIPPGMDMKKSLPGYAGLTVQWLMSR